MLTSTLSTLFQLLEGSLKHLLQVRLVLAPKHFVSTFESTLCLQVSTENMPFDHVIVYVRRLISIAAVLNPTKLFQDTPKILPTLKHINELVLDTHCYYISNSF